MHPRMLQPVLNSAYRGDDRIASAGTKPAVMQRRTLYLALALCVSIIVYITLFPFKFVAGSSFGHLQWSGPAGGDTMANILAYVPLGILLRLIFRRRGTWRVMQWILSLSFVAVLSYLGESVQNWLPARVPSWTDVICNLIGGAIGIALGPHLQNWLRNFHGWLYHLLRQRPFYSAAAVATLCVAVHALAPLDIHPTPGHILRSAAVLQQSVADFVQLDFYVGLPVTQVINKFMAAACYALPAFLLVFAAGEAGRSGEAGCLYALKRIYTLIFIIEGMQFFTISKTADPVDVLLAFCCAGCGALCGWMLLYFRPDFLRQPAAVLRGLVVAVAFGLAFWAGAYLTFEQPHARTGLLPALPITSDFARSWDGLLGKYVTLFLQFSLVAGLVCLWYRSIRRRPPAMVIMAVTFNVALIGGLVHAVLLGRIIDTANLILALLAGVTVIRLDRAVFDKRPADPAIETQTI